jgi:hypothetical protein
LARSAQQIDDLQNDRDILLAALKSIVNSPGFETQKHTDALNLIEKISEQDVDSVQIEMRNASREYGRQGNRNQTIEDSPVDTEASVPQSKAGENLVRSDVGSSDRLRELASAVDLDDGLGMPGYVGKMSDVSWLQKIRSHLSGQHALRDSALKDSHVDIQAPDSSSLSYFTDDVNLLSVDGKFLSCSSHCLQQCFSFPYDRCHPPWRFDLS